MFRMMSILVAEVQTARTGKRRKLLSLTRFGYQTLKDLENKMKRLTTVRFMSNNYGALQIFRTFLLTFFNQNWRHNYRFVSYNYFFGYR